jgi:hypothetical protein
MLNPSTADERRNDATIERCQRRATRWGYGGLVVTNLFAWCSTDPAGLRRAADPVGAANDAAILSAARDAGLVVCAWGACGSYRGRSAAVLNLLRSRGVTLHSLGRTKCGEPVHPLYIGYGQPLIPMGREVARAWIVVPRVSRRQNGTIPQAKARRAT